MKYIIISVKSGKQVPAVDAMGNAHWEGLLLRVAAAEVTRMNREAREKAYRLESL